MTGRVTWTSLILVAVTGIGAYTATVTTRNAAPAPVAASDAATEALLTLIDASPAQRAALGEHDPAFAEEHKKLREDLAQKRGAFAAAIENPDTPREAVVQRLDEVLAAESALEHRVVDYILSVRTHLTVDQQRKLLGMCAEEVRHGRGWQWGRGAGRGGGREGGHEDGDHQGGGGGHRWRGGRNPPTSQNPTDQ